MKHYDVLTLKQPGQIQATDIKNHFKVKSYKLRGKFKPTRLELKLFRTHLKNRILVQDRGGVKL